MLLFELLSFWQNDFSSCFFCWLTAAPLVDEDFASHQEPLDIVSHRCSLLHTFSACWSSPQLSRRRLLEEEEAEEEEGKVHLRALHPKIITIFKAWKKVICWPAIMQDKPEESRILLNVDTWDRSLYSKYPIVFWYNDKLGRKCNRFLQDHIRQNREVRYLPN